MAKGRERLATATALAMSRLDQREEELERLRRAIALAKFWLDRFSDPASFVWNTSGKTPQQMARHALDDLTAEETGRVAAVPRVPLETPRGTVRMERLERDRTGFVEFYQSTARQAINIGEIGAARAALRVLRTTDFGDQSELAEALFAVIRDSRSTNDEIAEAALRIASLPPRPADEADG